MTIEELKAWDFAYEHESDKLECYDIADAFERDYADILEDMTENPHYYY